MNGQLTNDGAGAASAEVFVARWAEVRAALRRDIGARGYDQWLKPAALIGYCEVDHVVRLALPSAFMASWVSSHYAERLDLTWKHFVPGVRAVRIEVSSSVGLYQLEAHDPVPDIVLDDPAPDAKRFVPNPKFTFANFVIGASNTIVANASRAIAEGGPLRFNPLYIQGATGQGKTHLLHAIAHGYQARKPRARVLYMSAERFMVDFVNAMRARETMAFKDRIRSADLLLIDDVQFIAGKDATQEEFLHTLEALMTSGKRLAISADRAPQALDGVEGRILSRLTQGLVVDIKPADLVLRRTILAQRAADLEGLHVPAEVLDLLAMRIASNLRELTGGFNRLVAYASLSGRAVTLDFAEEILADMFRASRRKITIDDIQRKVADHFKIRHAEMVSARRARQVARPRQIAMYLAKQLTPRSLPEIGRRFGGRDHTTVIYAVRQIEKLRGEDQELDHDVRMLIGSLQGHTA
jgi:chromosomal replication initiator protein